MSDDQKIIMFTSNFCPHSMLFERYFKRHEIAVELRNIDGDPDNRARVMELNRGNASVPTLLFADGTQLTEPSLGQLRKKLNIEEEGLVAKIKGMFS